jgi:hypothetical protein
MAHYWSPHLPSRPTATLQGMHEVAYTGGLARPLIVPESALAGLSASSLADFVARNYTAPRITLAGAGVSQADLVGLAQPLLDFLPKAAPEPQPASTYVGGDFRCGDRIRTCVELEVGMSCVESCWGSRVLFLALWVWRILSCFTIFGRHQELLDGGWILLDPL